MGIQELNKGDLLYTKGDTSQSFYFLLKGKLELVVDSGVQGEFKFSKSVDEYEFFGQRTSSSDMRNDYARAVAEKCWVILINKDQFELIVKKT